MAAQFDRVVKRCHCVRSKCLRLYCDCFAANVLCQGCKCVDCHNTPYHPLARQQAMEYKLARKKSAFDPKFQQTNSDQLSNEYLHVRGCNCKKSGCSKKYCECFQAGVACSAACKCKKCLNDGSLRLPRRDLPEVSDWIMVLAKSQQKFDEMAQWSGLLEGDQLLELADWVFESLVPGEVSSQERADRCEELLRVLPGGGTMSFTVFEDWLRKTFNSLSNRFTAQSMSERRTPKPVSRDGDGQDYSVGQQQVLMPYVFQHQKPHAALSPDSKLMPPPLPRGPTCSSSSPHRQPELPSSAEACKRLKRKRHSRPSIIPQRSSHNDSNKSARKSLLHSPPLQPLTTD